MSEVGKGTATAADELYGIKPMWVPLWETSKLSIIAEMAFKVFCQFTVSDESAKKTTSNDGMLPVEKCTLGHFL